MINNSLLDVYINSIVQYKNDQDYAKTLLDIKNNIDNYTEIPVLDNQPDPIDY